MSKDLAGSSFQDSYGSYGSQITPYFSLNVPMPSGAVVPGQSPNFFSGWQAAYQQPNRK